MTLKRHFCSQHYFSVAPCYKSVLNTDTVESDGLVFGTQVRNTRFPDDSKIMWSKRAGESSGSKEAGSVTHSLDQCQPAGSLKLDLLSSAMKCPLHCVWHGLTIVVHCTHKQANTQTHLPGGHTTGSACSKNHNLQCLHQKRLRQGVCLIWPIIFNTLYVPARLQKN